MTTTAVYARRFVSLVKFEHTVFALPFAFVGAILAAGEVPSAATLAWVTLAMVGARSLAMALNRLIDAEIDARNPRTAVREIPSGLLSRSHVLLFCVASLLVFLIAVWQLDPIVRWLWPIPVAAFVLYPYTKRFTWLCHLVLGLSTGMAPLGAWLAITGDVSIEPFLLWLAVALWIGGFDIIYATADVEFDRREGLHSLPSRFGIAPALMVTRVAHLLAISLLIVVGVSLGVGPFYYAGLAVVAALLGYENSIVHADDLSRVNVAFFTLNGVISMVFLAGVLADALT
ncbi:MAG: 4-hydroxybenzoate polyprenyltransferase [Gaiellales bacterium]|nr:4-hydroxybenzoate polyprenyltransferase [Gaiellales bacterium]MDX6591058.1 4-hydroxybenzoate polyprenyltransferase [Gaiellales bacterium]